MRIRRRLAAPLAVIGVVGLAACAPALPETVVPGSVVTVGWTGDFTSANAAAQPTAANLDIAAPTRARFGDLVDGEFVADEAFGTVTILTEDPFTVRYDLAEPRWSDDIPLDAADLALGWAAASGLLAPSENARGSEPAVPRIDEFARAIEVTYPEPIRDWQQRIAVAVPAHVVAGRAFNQDDPMEAKQALIAAIEGRDAAALAKIAEAWDGAFTIPEGGEVPADALLSSGPFRVDALERGPDGQTITLVPNAAYRGSVTPRVARIELVPAGEDPIAAIGERLDAARVAPVAADKEPIEALERRDFTVDTTHDGTVWALRLNPAGVFTGAPARAAFLRAIPARALIERGGGAWASAYTATNALLAAPGSRAYDVVAEDSGFTAALGGSDDPAIERESAGIAAGAQVCVLYDRASEFASGAFAAVRDAAIEAGWTAVDCGADDVQAALAQGGVDALIDRVPVPQGAAGIAAEWGSAAQTSLPVVADPDRDALISRFARTPDVYAARDVLGQIEATIVRAAVALPIALNPVTTIIDKDVLGIAPRSGADAPLTSGAVQWEVAP